MGTGGHFAKSYTAAVPGDDVTTIGDVNLSFIVTAFNTPRLVDRIKFWMQRPAKYLKRQFGNFGSDRKHNGVP